jgi:LacI family transcriptional regulator
MPRARKLNDRPKTTIRDVARLAGVSIGTVSNVLNPKIPVSEAKRAAVAAAIDSLNFLPNRVAQSLRRRQSRVVGLIAHDSKSAYFATLLDRFESIGATQGYEVMQVLSRSDPETEVQRTRALLERQVDGIILVPTAEPARTLELLAASGVPTVVVDRITNDKRFDYVTMDNAGAMVAAVGTLAAAGRKQVMFIVRWPELVTTRQRMEALASAGKKHRIFTETLVRAPADDDFVAEVREILGRSQRPDAIIASSSVLALPLLATLKGSGIKMPDEVSVIVFDEPSWATLIDPPLSIVRHPIDAIAQSAWRTLIERIEGYTGPYRRIIHSAEIVIRESVGSRSIGR